MSHDFRDYAQGLPSQPAPPPKSSKTPIILAAVGGFGLFMILVCCGAGVWVIQFGMNVISADIENQLRDHPQIKEHVGEIQTLEVDWGKSLAEDDYDIWTYDIEGSKARGEVIVESKSEDDGEVIEAATLRLSTGKTIELSFD
ncbi:MAG: hypothetical protein H6821_12815 [Planctomycetaceae bacterium]|nr:hypothetical protein [Planctomycetaceae bacterium]MCB9939924.1 hypothetical protein [Planctomycetaceae bacterium]HRX78634.1 hypothetical protein [Pirellulaceae bacterium]